MVLPRSLLIRLCCRRPQRSRKRLKVSRASVPACLGKPAQRRSNRQWVGAWDNSKSLIELPWSFQDMGRNRQRPHRRMCSVGDSGAPARPGNLPVLFRRRSNHCVSWEEATGRERQECLRIIARI